MAPWTLLDIDQALRASWAADTCSPDDFARAGWTADSPAWGHCDVTALLVNDLLGGDLMLGDVHSADGEQQGFHWWNRLPSGIEVDLTLEQFRDGQTITNAVSSSVQVPNHAIDGRNMNCSATVSPPVSARFLPPPPGLLNAPQGGARYIQIAYIQSHDGASFLR